MPKGRVFYKEEMQKTQQNCCKWLGSTARACRDAALSCTAQSPGCGNQEDQTMVNDDALHAGCHKDDALRAGCHKDDKQ